MWQRWFKNARGGSLANHRRCKKASLTGWERLEDRNVPAAPTIAITDGVATPAAGSLDLAFGGGDGIASVLTSGASQINAMKVLTDGRILGGGFVGSDFGLFRFNADGTPDQSFSFDGVATADFAASTDTIRGIDVAPDGKIVAVGTTGATWSPMFRETEGSMAVARFHADGTLDTSFDGDGRIVLDLGAGAEVFYGVVVQPDGKIVAVGMAQPAAGSTASDWVIARFNIDGSLDDAFGDGDGIAFVDFGPLDNKATTVLLQPDGKIVALGHAAHAFEHAGFAAARLTADGLLDNTFGSGGKFLFDPGADRSFEDLRGAALLPDGKIMAAGLAWRHTAGAQNDVVVLRLASNGTLDDTFGNGGAVFSDFVGTWNGASGVAVNGEGQAIVGGNILDPQNAFVARYNANGSLDPDFGATAAGLTVTDISFDDAIWAVAVTSDGDPLIAGQANGQAAVMRYLGAARGERATATEASQATVTGTFGDLDADTVTITATSGQITQDGTQNGTWSWSFTPTDGPDHTRSVTITATDGSGAQSSVTFDLLVNNVAPTIAVSGGPAVNKNAPYVLHLGAITDPGVDSITGYAIRWGESHGTGFIPIANFAPQAQMAFAVPGSHTIHVDLYDEDGEHRDAGLLNVFVRDAGPNLNIKQTVKPARTSAGATVTFRVSVANLGNWQAGGVFLTFRLPAGLKRIAAGSTPGWTAAGKQRFAFNVGTLAAGERLTVTFRGRLAKALLPGSRLTAIVTAGLDGLEGPDANPRDNSHRIRLRVQ